LKFVLLKNRIKKLEHALKRASTVDEWIKIAKQLDLLDASIEVWKNKDESPFYDYKRIKGKTAFMEKLRANQDIKALVRFLRTDLQKNLCGIANPELYKTCRLGTKACIEKYQNEVIKCIQFVYYYEGIDLEFKEKMEFFTATR
jgi:hypothetical protein